MEIKHKKNTAYELTFPMVDSSSPASFKSGLTVTVAAYKWVSGTWSALTLDNNALEIGSTAIYKLPLSADDLNYDYVLIKFTSAGAADSFVLFRMKINDIDDIPTTSSSIGEKVIG